jgi:post-segregation antitoxin (ccd killing protein)
MTLSAIVSIRIKKELKEGARRLGIDLRKLLEESLAKEMERKEKEAFERAVGGALEAMKGVDPEEFAEAIKEWRRKR